jgi:hypothetical protein
MAAPVIQFKRGIFSNLPGLRAGEPGFTTDKYDLYVGIDSTTNGNKFFGSHRYWTKETTTAGSGVNLVEGTNNGTNAITLKAPASIGSDVTYTFPAAAVDQGYLRTNSSGTLTWESGVNATGVSTISFLQATTANVSAAATVGTDLSVNRNLTVSGGISGRINSVGVSTIRQLQATTVNATGIITASSFRGADFRDTDGTLVPLIGVQTGGGHNGLVTAFKFVGTGLENYSVVNEVATITIAGVAASTYITSELVTATANQAAFTVSAGYQEGFVDVYLNGLRLVVDTDYTATNGTNVNLTTGAGEGDELEFVTYKSLGDIVAVQNFKTAGNITMTGFATVTNTFKASGGSVLSGVTTASQLLATTINSVGIITASQFNGSGAGISSNTLPILALDIAGGTALGSLTQNDLLIVADEGTGNIRKITAEQMSQYVLGGAGGATLPALKITGLSTFVGNATAEANLTVSGGITGRINSVGVSTISFLQATTANISAGATVGGALDVNGGADISGGETTLSSATVSDLTSGRVVLAGTAGALQDSANLTFGNNGLKVGAGGANITGISTFSSNVIISGDLTVNGTTTQINTVQTTVEDTLLELQMIDGSAPSSDTNKDVGLIMNYYDTQARKAAFFWDDSASLFVLAATASESNGVVSPATYGGLEIGSLYVNDCAGASQVISCSGTTRSLENITIDGGSF